MLTDLPRLAAFLARLLRGRLRAGDAARVVERRDLRDGLVHDTYEPVGRIRGCQVVLHGVTVDGKDDPRLPHFCRCLACVGIVCVVPTLPGLASLEWLPSDVDGLAAFTASTAARRGTVGLAGFSFGGSAALVAAARPGCSSAVASVFACGAYHSLDGLYDDLVATSAASGIDAEQRSDLDDWLYLRLVTAWRQRTRLGLGAEAQERLLHLLRGYCAEGPRPAALAFWRDTLRGQDPVPLDAAERNPDALAALSPAGQLSNLRCRVALLHDAADALVPPHHAARITREVASAGVPHRAAVTRLLRHVGVAAASAPADAARVLAVLLTLVRPAEASR